jgi:hypothetical protein
MLVGLQGGDWDRRNRLKVYEALSFIMSRNFSKAAELLLDCIATFTCVELTSYNQVGRWRREGTHSTMVKLRWMAVGLIAAAFLCVPVQFIFYAVITNILSLDRMKLKKRLVDGQSCTPPVTRLEPGACAYLITSCLRHGTLMSCRAVRGHVLDGCRARGDRGDA